MMMKLMMTSNAFFKSVLLILNETCQETSLQAALVCDYKLG